ncbi:MAG: tetratricopeptide repeat protein [Synechocystis sp.]
MFSPTSCLQPLTTVATTLLTTLIALGSIVPPSQALLADLPIAPETVLPETAEQRQLMEGFAQLEAGAPNQAIAIFSQVISKNSHSADAYNLRGVAYMVLEQYPKALADLTQAIRLNPNDPAIYFNRANVYGVLENFEAAAADCSAAILLDPNDADLFVCRGEAQLAIENPQAALPDFNQALKLNPRSEEALYFRGVAYAMLDNYAQALADFNRLLKLNPQSADALVLRAGIKAEQGDQTGSMEDMINAINLLERQGETQKAAEIRGLLGY